MCLEDLLAQLVEHYTFNVRVASSNLAGVTRLLTLSKSDVL